MQCSTPKLFLLLSAQHIQSNVSVIRRPHDEIVNISLTDLVYDAPSYIRANDWIVPLFFQLFALYPGKCEYFSELVDLCHVVLCAWVEKINYTCYKVVSKLHIFIVDSPHSSHDECTCTLL